MTGKQRDSTFCASLKLFCVSISILGLTNSVHTTLIPARTFAEFKSVGWVVTGTNPVNYAKPSAFKYALLGLDKNVTSSQVWRLASQNTIFKFENFGNDICNIKNVKVHVTLFTDNAAVQVSPWTNEAGSQSYYLGRPNGITWVYDTIEIVPENEITFKVFVQPGAGGFVLFDEITVEHDGIDCDLKTTVTATTEESTTTEIYTTIEDSSTSEITEETPVEESTPTGFLSTEESTGTELSTTEESTNTEFPTTEESTDTEYPSTEESTNTEFPSTERGSDPTTSIPTDTSQTTLVTEESTSPFPECSTATPQPEPCNCCDSCTPMKQEIHHHHYIHFSPAPAEEMHHHY